MELVNSFHCLLQVFALSMTEPTAVTFRELMIGWVFAPRRTVLGIVRCSGTTRHHAAFHRVFATAKWSMSRPKSAICGATIL